MRTLKALIIIALASFLWIDTTLAQTEDSPSGVSFGPQVGVSKSPDEDANFIFGAALRWRLLSALAIEGSINYREEKFAGDALTVRSWPIQVTGLVYPLPIVYGAMGAGWYMTTFDFDGIPGTILDDDTENDFGWHFGGGLEIPLGNAAKLVGDVRYVFLDYNFDAVPGSDEIDSDFYMVTAGFLFNL